MVGATGYVGLFLLFSAVCLIYQLDILFKPIDTEDAMWVREIKPLLPLRQTQTWLTHGLGLSYFGHRIILYRVVELGLHVVNAWLISVFFLLFCDSILGPLRRNWGAVAGGAVLSGLLFCVAPHYAVSYLSALAYQLVLTFSLGTLVWAVLYFRSPKPLFWLLAAGCYMLAMLSHSFSLLLPFLIMLLELATRGRPRLTVGRWTWVVRYGLLLALLAGVMWFHLEGLSEKGSRIFLIGSAPLRHLVMVGELYVMALQAQVKLYLQLEGGHLISPQVFLLALVLVTILALRELFSTYRSPGLGTALLLFFFVWCGMVFPMEMAISDSGLSPWRYYFHAAGGAVLMGYFAVRLLAPLSAWLTPLPVASGLIVWGLACTAVLVVAAGPAKASLNLARVLSSDTRWELPMTWHPPAACATLRRMNQAQLEAALNQGRELRCAGLQGLRLSGLNLRGIDLRGANLTGAYLEGTSLQKARLDGAALLWARAGNVDLRWATLHGADLSGAFLNGASLEGSDLRGANLRWSVLHNTVLLGANLAGAYIEGTDLTGANLQGVNLAGTRFKSANMLKADLRGARLPAGVKLNAVGFGSR